MQMGATRIVSKFKPWMATGRDRVEWFKRSTIGERKVMKEEK